MKAKSFIKYEWVILCPANIINQKARSIMPKMAKAKPPNLVRTLDESKSVVPT
jgi:hypothetical protein